MKKVLSILLSLALCLGMLPGAALAEGDVATVTINGASTPYQTLEDAVTAAQAADKATITLLQDVVLGDTLEISGSAELILDLAGYTITCNDNTTMSAAGTVTIQDKSAGKSGAVISTNGLAIAVPGTLTLEGGTFDGSNNTIQLGPQNATMNVADLLGSGYAYYRDGAPILLDSLSDNLTGTVTVKECEHPDISNNDCTQSGTCPYCGTELAITKPTELTVSGVTVEPKTYDGTNVVEIQSVALSGVAQGDDVSVDISGLKGTVSGSNVGEYNKVTLPTMTLTGADAGNYTLTQPTNPFTASVTISKAAALTPNKGDLAVSNTETRTYTFGLGGLRPDVPAGLSLGSEAVTYELGTVSLNADYYDANTASISGQTLTLPIKETTNMAEGSIGTIDVIIKTQNYQDMTATINVRSVNKKIPTGTPALSTDTLTYGQKLGTITLSGGMKFENEDVPGTFKWGNQDNVFASVGSYQAGWEFTPDDNTTYAKVQGTSAVTVNPAPIDGAEVELSPVVFASTPTLDNFNSVTVTLNGKQLARDTDYTLSIAGNKVVATGTGNYAGSASVEFEVPELKDTGETDGSGNKIYYQIATALEPMPSNPPSYSVEDIQTKLQEAIESGYTAVIKNVRLVYDTGGEVRMENINLPSIIITLPYPAGTGPTGWDFIVKHMKHDGTIETVHYETANDGLKCTFHDLSPVAIGYKAKSSGGGSSGGSGGGGGGGSWVRYYKVMIEDSAHGRVTADHTSMYSGGTVTLTAAPDEGFELDGITVTDSSGRAVELTEKDGRYSFKMPSSDVTVSAGFKEPPPEPWANPFPDVSDTGWYIEAIGFVCREGLMAGYSNGLFGPDDNITRAQFAQMLYNKEGRPEAAGGRFTDVRDCWYTDAVNWAAAQGVAAGTGGGKFAPDAPITREQLAAMLWRYADSPEPGSDALDFADAGEASRYARKALCWASENGIMSGKGSGLLDPQGETTRAEAAQMLMQYLKK